MIVQQMCAQPMIPLEERHHRHEATIAKSRDPQHAGLSVSITTGLISYYFQLVCALAATKVSTGGDIFNSQTQASQRVASAASRLG